MSASDYKAHVASLGCIMRRLGEGAVCRGRVTLHHPREGQGIAQRASDWLVIGLCEEHHQGAFGIHEGRAFTRRTKLDEMDLLAETIKASWE